MAGRKGKGQHLHLPGSVSEKGKETKKETMDKAKLEKVAHATASHLHCPSCAKGLHRAFDLPCGRFICDLCMSAFNREASCEGMQSHGQCPECHKLYRLTHEVFVDGLRNPCFESCILSHNTQYMFRVRCVNKHGARE
ncbi:hypothetical protein J4Q44_G00185410 [Coregonus suidteri]|uniref:RING-type domain-containing protein n=1 Tax=Coregonus suidteri TaxID=861788 RepID=A0AAN8M047_9TELE